MEHDIKSYKFIKKIKSLPFVQQVILFGSRARGTNQARSDIDLAVLCPDATRDQWLDVVDIVENADTLLRIDCVRLDQVKDLNFKNNILKDGVPLWIPKQHNL